MADYVGKPVKCGEDSCLITGEAQYIDDVQLPGMRHAAVLCSPHAYARIKSINTDHATAAPGVVGVFAEQYFMVLNLLLCAWRDGRVENITNTLRVLESEKVTFAGTDMAVVVAETGQIAIEHYIAIDDVGNVINPMIVDGQVHGGIVQGVGQALWEGATYDENGQLVSDSLMDYSMSRADRCPPLKAARRVMPTPVNPLGVKGADETGTIAAPPAAVNTVMDALSPPGITHPYMSLTTEKGYNEIHSANRGGD